MANCWNRVIDSPLGPLRLEASDAGLTAIRFGAAPEASIGEAAPDRASAVLEQAERELGAYFAGRRRSFEVGLDLRSTLFRQRVWRALLAIGYGETISYAELARRVGDDRAVRAVGQANGANPVPIIVPCHRVVRSNGSIGGYGGGLEIKRRLLALEGAAVAGEQLTLC